METTKANRPWVFVRGAGDLATGTILRLHRCGFKVLALECADPSAIRRKAAFCEAVWQGSATVEGAVCRRIDRAEDAATVSAAGEIPLLVDDSDLEKRISNAYEGLEFGQSRSDTIVSFNSNHIIDLGEEDYLCDVTYEVDTLGRDGELHRSVNNAWLFLVRADDTLKVDRLLSY